MMNEIYNHLMILTFKIYQPRERISSMILAIINVAAKEWIQVIGHEKSFLYCALRTRFISPQQSYAKDQNVQTFFL